MINDSIKLKLYILQFFLSVTHICVGMHLFKSRSHTDGYQSSGGWGGNLLGTGLCKHWTVWVTECSFTGTPAGTLSSPSNTPPCGMKSTLLIFLILYQVNGVFRFCCGEQRHLKVPLLDIRLYFHSLFPGETLQRGGKAPDKKQLSAPLVESETFGFSKVSRGRYLHQLHR